MAKNICVNRQSFIKGQMDTQHTITIHKGSQFMNFNVPVAISVKLVAPILEVNRRLVALYVHRESHHTRENNTV